MTNKKSDDVIERLRKKGASIALEPANRNYETKIYGSDQVAVQGKLVGLAFDGNWESVSSNWVFDPVMTRMISVDQRYMRWIMQEVYPAPQVLAELGVPEKN